MSWWDEWADVSAMRTNLFSVRPEPTPGGWLCPKCGALNATQSVECQSCKASSSAQHHRAPLGCPRCWAICRVPCGVRDCEWKPL